MERKNGYIYGSAAPKLPEKVERPIERQGVQKKELAVPHSAYSTVPKAKMMAGMLFMVAICFVILYRFSAITELNYNMEKLNSKYNKLRADNRMLQVDIETGINLDRVKEIAETKLAMHKPESYQIVVVSVPKNNYSVVVDQAYINKTTLNTSLMENLVNALKAVLP